MTFNCLPSSQSFQYERNFFSNLHRKYFMNRFYTPKPISRSPSRNKSSYVAFDQLIDNQNDSLTLNRETYRLRMKSDLNIDTLPDVHHRHRRLPIRTNSNVNMPISSSTKAITKQSTNVNEDVKGIEGNAIRIETFPKFRQQFDLPETQFISLSKSHSFIQERPVKQVQALTEYQFSTPTLLRTKKTVDDIDLINQSRQRFNSLEQQRSPDMRRQGSHKKSVTYIDKQIYTCHKLNINDTIHQETIIPLSKHPSVNFIFPYMRPCRYLTQLTSPSNPINSDSFKQHTDYNAMQSIRNSIEYDDDLHNPQNTIINFNMNQDMQ